MNHKSFLQRFLHTSVTLRAAFNKSDLSKLRNKTGYAFSNCKKALEVNNNDIILAEKWLKEQAQALGWSKATKLEGRSTLQGLIGVSLENCNSSLMLEVNCETDFVARNKYFRSLVGFTAETCFKHFQNFNTCNSLEKVNLDSNHLKNINCPEGKTLADHAALTISKVGENITLRRAIFIKSSNDIYLAGYTHPSPEKLSEKVFTGKYGALIAYTAPTNDETVQQIARQLCQHIVGMNPIKVGTFEVDEPLENKDDEVVMIHQDFLLDPSVTVGQLIQDVGLNVVDFIRFECGESIEEQPAKLNVNQ